MRFALMTVLRRRNMPYLRRGPIKMRCCGLHPAEGWASWHVQSGPRLQELMELGSWSGYEMVLRYAHLATDHLRDTAGRIHGTFTPHRARPRLVRVAQVIDSDGGRDSLE